MHELSLMTEVLSIVEAAARGEGMTEVHKVKLVIGDRFMVMEDSLRFAFEILKKDSIAETAALELETRTGREFYVEYIEGE